MPSPGSYDTASEPRYIRGAVETASVFASTVPRFRELSSDTPGPSDYSNVLPDMSLAGHTLQDRKARQGPAVRKPEVRTAAPIPYTAPRPPQKVGVVDRADARNRWIVQERGDALLTPGPALGHTPAAYVAGPPSAAGKRLPSPSDSAGLNAGSAALAVQTQLGGKAVPAGGASSSLARPDFLPPMPKFCPRAYAGTSWARAPGRAEIFSPEEAGRAGPGAYDVGQGDIGQKAALGQKAGGSTCFSSGVDRFALRIDKDLQGLSPGSYRVEDAHSIAAGQEALQRREELRGEVRRTLAQNQRAARSLHPGVGESASPGGRSSAVSAGAVKPSDPAFLRAMGGALTSPAPGAYNICISDFDAVIARASQASGEGELSSLAVQRLALKQTFDMPKWPESAPVIPSAVVTDDIEDEQARMRAESEAADVQKALRYTSVAPRSVDFGRGAGRDAVSVDSERLRQRNLAPGTYDAHLAFDRAHQPRSFAMGGTAAFKSELSRDRLYAEVEEQRKNQDFTQKRLQQLQEEKASEAPVIGGKETTLNYNQLRYYGKGRGKDVYVNSTRERTMDGLLAGVDLRNPGVGDYDTSARKANKAPRLYLEDRKFMGRPAPDSVPTTLTPQIAGPSAHQAARVLLQERQRATPGPGYYVPRDGMVKRSFNILAEDNQ